MTVTRSAMLSPARRGRTPAGRRGRRLRRRPAAPPDLRRGAPLRQRRVVAAVAGVDLLLPAAALADAAPHGAVALRHLLRDEARAARRTRLRDGAVPGHELALRVAVAAVEELAAPRAALHQLALAAAEQALHARRHRLVDRLHVLALRAARAAEELPVATEADLHRTAALLAHLVRRLGLDRTDRAVVVAGEVLRVLALGVRGAGEEFTPSAPLDDERLAALLAREAGRALLALHVAHLDLGLLEVLRERVPEAAKRVDVVLLALLDGVELVLHAGGELDVEDVGE